MLAIRGLGNLTGSRRGSLRGECFNYLVFSLHYSVTRDRNADGRADSQSRIPYSVLLCKTVET